MSDVESHQWERKVVKNSEEHLVGLGQFIDDTKKKRTPSYLLLKLH